MNKITKGKVTDMVQGLIADITNREKATIFLRLNLRDDPPGGLGVPQEGIRGLASKLNDEFVEYNLELTVEMTQAQQTVENLVDLVWREIPESQKEM
ncbi:MAG: hypothetical protein QNJ60_09265 [Xenococcaceae cyanobacterium MO_188.B19]|nr:hypothetical protein [Xenococcaceae cyanobacterium MO_188.B19]